MSHLSCILRSGSKRHIFTKKHSSTINVASFNLTVTFDASPLNTTSNLCLSIEFHAFFCVRPSGVACINTLKSQIIFKLPTVLIVTQDLSRLTARVFGIFQVSSLFETCIYFKRRMCKINFKKLKSYTYLGS